MMSHAQSLHRPANTGAAALARVDDALRRKPLPSVALALVLGFLLASLATPAR
jgi:hypothetical protein